MSSMLTGVYPYRANRRGLMPEKAPGAGFQLDADTIASYLDTRSGGFHSNPFLSRSFGYDDGWDRLDDDLYLGNSKIITLLKRFLDKIRNRHYSPAEEINESSLEWLDSGSGDFFLWNHYMDPHGPYQPPEEFKGIYQGSPISDSASQELLNRAINSPKSITEDERQRLVDLYDEETRYTDSQVEQFFSELEERELLEDTLVIVVGDHGEAFGHNGFYEHGEELNELLRVPLILVDGKDREISAPCSVVDVAVTILETLGKQIGDLDGIDLRRLAENEQEYGNRTVYSQETKNDNLIFSGYDGRDFVKLEPENKSEIDSSGETGLEKKVAEYAERAVGEDESDDRDEEMEEEVKERLEALGYMEDKSR
jgi:arylsulfatase